VKDRNKALADLGYEVRRIREDKGLSIEDVTEITKIRTHFLEGIEAGDYSSFPSGVYIRGFVKSYLSFLGAEDMWTQFKPYLFSEEILDTSELILGNFTPPTRGFKHTSRLWVIVLMLVVIAGLAWYGLAIWNSRDRGIIIAENETLIRETVPSVEEKLSAPPEKDISEQRGSSPNIPLAMSEDQLATTEISDDLYSSGVVSEDLLSDDLTAVPAKDQSDLKDLVSPDNSIGAGEGGQQVQTEPLRLSLSMTRDCWVKLSTEDKTLFQGIIKKDTQRVFEITDRTEVVYGRPGSVTVVFNDQELGNPGKGGTVARWYYSPNGDKGPINR